MSVELEKSTEVKSDSYEDSEHNNDLQKLDPMHRAKQEVAEATSSLLGEIEGYEAQPIIEEEGEIEEIPSPLKTDLDADIYAKKYLNKGEEKRYERGRTKSNYPVTKEGMALARRQSENFDRNQAMVKAPRPGSPRLLRLSMAERLEAARRYLYKLNQSLRIVIYSGWRPPDRTQKKYEEAKKKDAEQGTKLAKYLADEESAHERCAYDLKLTDQWGKECSMTGYAQQDRYAELKKKFQGVKKKDISPNDIGSLKEYDEYLKLNRLQIGNEILACVTEAFCLVTLVDPKEVWHREPNPERERDLGIIPKNADLSQYEYAVYNPDDPNNQTEVLDEYPYESLYDQLKREKEERKNGKKKKEKAGDSEKPSLQDPVA